MTLNLAKMSTNNAPKLPPYLQFIDLRQEGHYQNVLSTQNWEDFIVSYFTVN